MIPLSFQVSPEDDLPGIICKHCKIQLDSCNKFRKMAKEAQRALKNFIQYASKLTGNSEVNINYFDFNCNDNDLIITSFFFIVGCVKKINGYIK